MQNDRIYGESIGFFLKSIGKWLENLWNIYWKSIEKFMGNLPLCHSYMLNHYAINGRTHYFNVQ